jgi:hypothetical protein
MHYAGSAILTVPFPDGIGEPPWTLTEGADRGIATISGFDVEDATQAWSMVGLGDFYAEESAASPVRIFTGYLGDRNIGRGVHEVMAGARLWTVQVVDLNTQLNDLIIRDGKRPAETDVDRINWLHALAGIPFAGSYLYDASGPVNMPASDYTGRHPFDVLLDCSNQSNKTFYLFYGGAASRTGAPLAVRLAYHAPVWASNTAAGAISNLPGDINGTSVFAPAATDYITRSPARVYSGCFFEYSGGSVWVPNATTLANFRRRELHSVDMSVTDPATATTLATAYLARCGTEEDTTTVHLHNVPAASLGYFLPGQRVSVTLSHVEAYAAGAYMAITQRTVIPHTVGFYDLDLECANPILTGFWGVGHKNGLVMTPPPLVDNTGSAQMQAFAGQTATPLTNSQMALAAPGALTLGTSKTDAAGTNNNLPWYTCWAGSGTPTMAIVADATWPGSNYLQASFDALGSATTHNPAVTSDFFPVRGNWVLKLVVTQAALVKAGSTVQRVFTVDWYKSDRVTLISTSTIASDAVAASGSDYTLGMGTQYLGLPVTAPAAASYARLTANLYETAGHNAANWWRWGELGMVNAVTADTLVVGSSGQMNLTNPDFETGDLTGWMAVTPGSSAIAVTDLTAWTCQGQYACTIYGGGAGDNPYLYQPCGSVAPGEYVVVSALLGNTSNLTTAVGVSWFDKTGAFISGSIANLGPTGLPLMRYSAILGPAPANTAVGTVYFANLHAGTYSRVDDVQVTRQLDLVNALGNVVINAAGVAITNGKLTVTNAGATVIIDGTSDIFKIVATGTVQTAICNPNATQTATVDLSTGLTFAPAIHCLVQFVTGYASQTPWISWGLGNGLVYTSCEADAHMVNTNQTRLTATTRNCNNSGQPTTVLVYRYYIFKEVAF